MFCDANHRSKPLIYNSLAMSTPGYLKCFQSRFTLIPMMLTVKNTYDQFKMDQKAVRGGSLDSGLK